MAVHPAFRTWPAVAVAACLCLPAAADDRYGCAQPLRLAFYRNQVFYRDGQGLDADLVAELERRSGCRFDVSVQPRAAIWSALRRGELDLATSGVATVERRRYAYFVPYLYLRERLIVPLDLASDLRGLDDFHGLPGVRLGAIAGYDHGPYLDAMLRILRSEGRVREYPDEASCFSALLNGQVEGLIGHELSLAGLLRDPALRHRFRVIDVGRGPGVPRGLMLARGHFSAAQAAQWQRLLEDLRLDGTLVRIYLRNAPLDVAAALLDNGYRPIPGEQGEAP
ncbi:substrate-binding periplasmic protein [Pseudomonas citronellolis]|uniref:substrate-binding periplasmic protein n=1 Tax=Pseudomonas citronellolis TaxID=53408 RepID=UPI0023E41D0B|nr:transporter substrate-binding domain-containing protein [Pseudomonas citronellolis]MDF3933557.1 transporter substrate-binding domain-containing protein [Pseudomonas citronellolis]